MDLPTPDDPRIAAVRARQEERAELVETRPGPRGHGDHGHARRDRVHRDQSTVDVVGEVGLVEDDDRRHAARPGDREIALDPAQVEVVVETRDQERDVDVRGHDLLVVDAGPAPRRIRRHPLEHAPARQDRGHDIAGVEHDPVADRREVGLGERGVPERAGDRHRPVARRVADDRRLAMDGDDAGRPKPVRAERGMGLGPGRIPAQLLECERRSSRQPTRFSLPVRLA